MVAIVGVRNNQATTAKAIKKNPQGNNRPKNNQRKAAIGCGGQSYSGGVSIR